MKKLTFNIAVSVWLYPGDYASWHFVTVPKKESSEISEHYAQFKKGWGSLPVEVTLGKTVWKTSIFPDRKSGTYILPLKASVRKSEGVRESDKVTIKFSIIV
ncbi:MAG: DUF1905 domain-containing protein [Minisyncoccia bacterium]